MKIYLVGYTGSGKSSVGRELARRAHWPFLDCGDIADRMAKRAGTHYDCVNRGLMMAAAEIGTDVVVATGGYDARAIAKLDPDPERVIVWIRTPFAVIWQRLGVSGWGNRKKQLPGVFEEGYRIMEKSYSEAAQETVDGSGLVTEVCDRVAVACGKYKVSVRP